MLKFLHMADLHLGIPYDKMPASKAETCHDMQFTVLRQMIHEANERSVDAILIAGDLFDSPTPSKQDFDRAMAMISRAQCPVLLSPGNHDHICADSVYLREALPKNLHIFTTTVLAPYALRADTMVWGAAFDGTSASIPLQAPLSSAMLNICLVHTDLRTISGYNHYTPEQIAESGFHYLAAGHNHTGGVMKRAGKTWYCRPGALMATKASEIGSKGCFCVELDDNNVRIDPIISDGIEFWEREIDLTPIPSDVGLQKAILPLIPQQHNRVAMTFRFTGERVYEPNFSALQNALVKVFFHVTLVDDSTQKKPLWRYLQTDDLRGAVSRNFREHIQYARDENEKESYLLAFRYALSAFDDDLPPR